MNVCFSEPDPSMRMTDDMMDKLVPKELKQLPSNLSEAVDLLDGNQVMRDYLGQKLVDAFITKKREEWKEFNKEVTPGEMSGADSY